MSNTYIFQLSAGVQRTSTESPKAYSISGIMKAIFWLSFLSLLPGINSQAVISQFLEQNAQADLNAVAGPERLGGPLQACASEERGNEDLKNHKHCSEKAAYVLESPTDVAPDNKNDEKRKLKCSNDISDITQTFFEYLIAQFCNQIQHGAIEATLTKNDFKFNFKFAGEEGCKNFCNEAFREIQKGCKHNIL